MTMWHAQILRYLTETAKVDLQQKDAKGRTALQCAADANQLPGARYLGFAAEAALDEARTAVLHGHWLPVGILSI